jgi:hypothetical protein
MPRVGRSLELEARCLFEDPSTTVHGAVVSGRALQREREPLAHAEVSAGGREGRADETTREHLLGSNRVGPRITASGVCRR